MLFAVLALSLAFGMAACALPSPVPADDGSGSVASDFAPGSGTTSSSSSGYLVDTTDMVGNTIRLSAYPERIVVLDPADCEILFALGAGDSVVGRTAICDYPSETNVIPFVTVNNKSDSDLILLREPQLVVMSADDAADADLVNALNSSGIPMLVTNATDVNNLYGAINLLGTVTNHTAEANALVSQLITGIAEMQAKVSQNSETVYIELSPLEDGLTTDGAGTIFNALVTLLGFHNEFEDQTGVLAVTQDQVIGRNPDFIITTTKSSSADQTEDATATDDPNAVTTTTLTGTEEILARADWAEMTAIVNSRVYYIDASLITRAGPRILEGLDALYTALYEEHAPTF